MLELKINDQRLIPVRLIPFVTGWMFSPDADSQILANKEKWHRVFIKSYHLNPDNNVIQMLPKEWDVVNADLEILAKSLKAQENHEDDFYSKWRIESIKTLPSRAFVWLSDLEEAWQSTYTGRWKSQPTESASDKELNLHPYLPKDLYSIIFEGFETLVSIPSYSKVRLANQYINFNELHQYMTIDPFYGVYSAATESLVREIYGNNSSNWLLIKFRHDYSLKHFKNDKVRELIYLWCGFMGLPAYQNNQLLTWQRENFVGNWAENFQIKMAELVEFLRKNSWPLPSSIYPGEMDSTERKVLLGEKEYEKGSEVFTAILPRLKKDLEELQNIQPESMDALNHKKSEIEHINQQIYNIISGKNVASDKEINSAESIDEEKTLKTGSPEWRSENARKAANIRHDKSGGSREKQRQIREIWATGKYSSKDLCAEEEYQALNWSFASARRALINEPDPKPSA